MANNLSLIDSREFDPDRALPENEWGVNTAVTGAPRSAKNAAETQVALRWAETGLGSQLRLFPDANENAKREANHFDAKRLAKKLIIDHADNPHQSIPMCVLRPSNHPLAWMRAVQDSDAAWSLVETSLRGREGKSEWHPLLEEGLHMSARLILKQPKPVKAIEALLSIGKFHKRGFRTLLDNVQDDDTYWFWRPFEKCNGQVRTGLAAIMRNIDLNWNHPQFLWRDSLVDGTDELIADGWTVLVEGSVTDRFTTNFMRVKIRKFYDLAERLHHEGDEQHRRLTVDEWANYDLIDKFEISHGLARGPKHHVSTTLISQSCDTGDPHLNRVYAQMMHRKEAFRSGGYAEAMEMSQFLFTPALDPQAVWYTEERKRQVTDYSVRDYATETKSSGKSGENDTSSKSVTRAQRLEPEQRTEIDEVLHRFPIDKQILLGASVLMGFAPGTRAVGHFGDVYQEQVSFLDDEPWGFKTIGDRKRLGFYQAMKNLPHYVNLSTGELDAMFTVPSVERIPSHSTNSTGSSNGTRKGSTRTTPTKLSRGLSKPTEKKSAAR